MQNKVLQGNPFCIFTFGSKFDTIEQYLYH